MNDAAQIADLDASNGSWGASTFALKHPFQWKGVTYAEVDMRVPTGLDMQQFYDSKDATTFSFMSGLSQVPVDALNVMHAEDFAVLWKWAMSFFPAAQ